MTIITSLISGPGKYSGTGVNHEGEPFMGTMVVQQLLNDMGVMLHYEATVSGGHRVHAESTLIAPDMEGNLVLWPVMLELPGVLPPRQWRLPKVKAFFPVGPVRMAVHFVRRLPSAWKLTVHSPMPMLGECRKVTLRTDHPVVWRQVILNRKFSSTRQIGCRYRSS